MAARSKARKRALDVLYASELRGRSAGRRARRSASTAGERPVNDYTVDAGARASPSTRPRIDELLATYAQGWTLDRMPAVDRNVLRLGVFELLYVDDVPDAVAVTEALQPGARPLHRRVAGVRQRRPRRDPARQGRDLA